MPRFKKIGFYIILGIFLLGFTMVRAGFENDYSFFIWLGAIGMAIGFIVYLFIQYQNKQTVKQLKTASKKRIEHLKNTGRKTTVNLEDIWFKEIYLNDPIANDPNGPTLLDDYINQHPAPENAAIHHYLIEIPYQGAIISYPFNAKQNKTDLKIHFVIQKTTQFYTLDDDFYLNLEFLDGSGA